MLLLVLAYNASAQTFDLGSELTGADPIRTTNGCNYPSCSAYCTSSGTGDHAATPCTGIITVPAGQYVSISLASNTCSSTSGLDNGDNVTINGSNLPQAPYSSNESVIYSACYYNPNSSSVDITIVLTANRRDETINVDYSIFSSDPGGCIALSLLPIELTEFTAKQVQGGTAIHWGTASESDNAFFSLERSEDGINFREIHREKGAGTSNEVKSYQFIDGKPINGMSYYRLRQVDNNGSENFSKVISIHGNNQAGIEFFPTIANETVFIRFDDPTSVEGSIQVFDQWGRLVKNLHFGDGTEELTIPVAELLPGQYTLLLSKSEQQVVQRFFKL